MRSSIPFLFLLFISCSLFSQSEITKNAKKLTIWADSVLKTMTLEEKIGQLIMVTTTPSQGIKNEKQIEEWIEKQHVGGVLFLKTTPYELASRANNYQAKAKIPLFIAIDGENGLSFRLDSVVHYPYAMALGAVQNDSLIYQMGREIGQQCKALGVNLNFAPVADVNSNPNNPIINYRSFGENPYKVAQKSWQLAKGMQDEKIVVTAKHFPGHGDTEFDSHLTLPVNAKDYDQLKQLDFLPFQSCINGGINGIMSAHISFSLLDPSNRPATLSSYLMTCILRDSMGFDGLIFSDGMNMKGITIKFTEEEAAVEALKAGVDVIEFVLKPGNVIKAVLEAIKKGEITENHIEEKCRKVLMAKKWAGLNHQKKADLTRLSFRLNKAQYKLTSRYLHEKSITVLQNLDSILPLQRLDTLKIASLAIGSQTETVFQKQLENYMSIDHFCIGIDASEKEIKSVLNELKAYNLVVAGIHGTTIAKTRNYRVSALHLKVADALLTQNQTILVFFSNPYALAQFNQTKRAKSIVVIYGETNLLQELAAQLVFGAIDATGKLPITISDQLKEGTGIDVKKNDRLKYTIPEEVGFDSNLLKNRIDSVINFGIKEKMFPGCQVLVAKNGKVVHNKSYGYFTYDSTQAVNNTNLYDWASITKISGPLPLLMKLTENSVLQLDKPFSNYWTDFKGTDKAFITLRQILAHQAGFKSWIPFSKGTLNERIEYRNSVLRSRPSINFPIRVSSNVYVERNFKQSMFNEIAQLELSKNKKYFYSDLAFYLFPDLISKLSGQNYEEYLNENFLYPLGASSVHYNPYRFYSENEIAPTEFDDTFRKELVHGFVHDESAALLGGVSGNAGLFGNANDLAKVMQLYLQNGKYGDFNFLKPTTVKEFTRIQYPDNGNRRGLGFDKPYINNSKNDVNDTYPAPEVSPNSFGHSGYTGTFVWADPENQLLYIFLTNRVYPTRDNRKLITLKFRIHLQQEIYKCQNSFEYTKY